MPDSEQKVTETAATNQPAPDQSKAPEKQQSETSQTQQSRSVSGDAFDKAVSRLTAEKWDLKRALKERDDKIAQLEAAAATRQAPPAKDSADQEFKELLGDKQETQVESQSDVDARIARLENAQKLQDAANELQVLHEKYPEVDPDNVLAALQKDGRNLDSLELYYMAERGRIADTIRAQRDADSKAIDEEVAHNSTEGATVPATHTDDYAEIADDVEAFRAFRRDKAARSK